MSKLSFEGVMKYKLVITLIIVIILSGTATALQVLTIDNVTTNITGNSDTAGTGTGVVFQVINPGNLTYIRKFSNTNPVMVRIFNGTAGVNESIITNYTANFTFSGDLASNINIFLPTGLYTAQCYASGSNFNRAFIPVNYTVAGVNINYTIGLQNDAATDNLYTRCIAAMGMNITTIPSTSISFQGQTPTNGTALYFINNVTLNASESNFGGTINITETIYNLDGSIFTTVTNTTNNSVNTFYLPVGQYLFNATASNITHSNFTDTRFITIYNITSGSITYPPNNQNITRYLTINWTNSTTTNNTVTINNYNIYLTNLSNNAIAKSWSTTGLNITNYDMYINNISLGTYNITIETNDNQTNKINSTQVSINLTHNALLNITAQNISIVQIFNFNISILELNTSTIKNFTTTNGYVESDIIRGYIYNITIFGGGIATSTFQYSATNNPLQTTTLTILPSNSINITILDEQTNNVITQPINIQFANMNNLFNFTVSTGNTLQQQIIAGDYELTFTSQNYSTRTYEVTIYNQTTQALTARLLTNNQSSAIGIYTKNNVFQVLPQVLITIQRQYNGGSFATIFQGYTDTSGFITANLQQAQNYQVILSAAGYNLKSFNQQFYTVNSPYTFTLLGTSPTQYISIFSGVNYFYTPVNITIPNATTTFTISTFNSSFTIAWTAVQANNTIINVTGSPGGGTAAITADLREYSGTFPVNYSFSYLDPNTGTYQVYNIPINYYIQTGIVYQNASIPQTFNTLKTDIGNTGWLTILAIFITLTAVITVMQLTQTPIGGVATGFGMLILFAFVGWISGILVFVIVFISALLLYVERQY